MQIKIIRKKNPNPIQNKPIRDPWKKMENTPKVDVKIQSVSKKERRNLHHAPPKLINHWLTPYEVWYIFPGSGANLDFQLRQKHVINMEQDTTSFAHIMTSKSAYFLHVKTTYRYDLTPVHSACAQQIWLWAVCCPMYESTNYHPDTPFNGGSICMNVRLLDVLHKKELCLDLCPPVFLPDIVASVWLL